MGSWGGAGFAALFGGLMAQNVGWRWIFFTSVAVSVAGLLMVHGTPESRATNERGYKFDTVGILPFMIAMVALEVFAAQGAKFGWTSVATLGLLAVSVVFGVMFFRTESHNANAFVDFRLFRNMTYTRTTLSNLLLNAVSGILIVAMSLVQIGGGMSAQGAGLLTLGYAVAIVAFIRVGEKLLRRLGPRRPMTWGCLIVGVSILLLMPTNVVVGTYKILAIVAFTLFGIGLGLYATPSTEAALFAFGANLLIDAAAIIAILLTVPKGRLREEPYG